MSRPAAAPGHRAYARHQPAAAPPATCCPPSRWPRPSSTAATRWPTCTTSARGGGSRRGWSRRPACPTRSSTWSASSAGWTAATSASGPSCAAPSATRPCCSGRAGPRVVVSVGGYASLPAVLAARRLRIPIVVVSYDRRPGRASQLAARFAAASAVAFPGSGLPRARLTGAPLRRAVLDVDPARDRAAAREALGLPPDRFVVLVVGGSLGSAVLNDVVRGFVALSDRAPRPGRAPRRRGAVPDDDDATAAAGPARDGILYTVVGYEERMPQAYAAADLVVARAGASTVAELAAIGVPSILVPWPGAAADHQTDNARSLGRRRRRGAAPRVAAHAGPAGARDRAAASRPVDAAGHGRRGPGRGRDPPQRPAGPPDRRGGRVSAAEWPSGRERSR